MCSLSGPQIILHDHIFDTMAGGGGGRTRANSVCFTKNVVKIGAFPNGTPTSKIWKNLSVDQKIKDAVVYGWGTQIFPKSPKENKNSLNMSTVCLLRKIDAQ